MKQLYNMNLKCQKDVMCYLLCVLKRCKLIIFEQKLKCFFNCTFKKKKVNGNANVNVVWNLNKILFVDVFLINIIIFALSIQLDLLIKTY
jgi:hypothetical protein